MLRMMASSAIGSRTPAACGGASLAGVTCPPDPDQAALPAPYRLGLRVRGRAPGGRPRVGRPPNDGAGARLRLATRDPSPIMEGLPRLIRASTRVLAVLMLLGAPALTSAGQLTGDTLPKLQGDVLINELRKGGHVVYFRHG